MKDLTQKIFMYLWTQQFLLEESCILLPLMFLNMAKNAWKKKKLTGPRWSKLFQLYSRKKKFLWFMLLFKFEVSFVWQLIKVKDQSLISHDSDKSILTIIIKTIALVFLKLSYGQFYYDLQVLCCKILRRLI